jgi:hypothetical protein
MAVNIKDTMSTHKKKEKADMYGLMETNSTAIGTTMLFKEKVSMYGQTEEPTVENGTTT